MTAGFGKGADARRWTWVLALALFVVVAWQLLGIVSKAATENLEFDGGMNLEVAKSIANGEGPRGRYHLAPFYPPAVQSKEPFYLAGAAVYKVAGVGPVQGQATNLLFLGVLLALVVAIVARATNIATGMLAACFVLAIPQMAFYGLNGYGEIATMCFGLGAMIVLAWPTRLDTRGWMRPFLAGALAALAIATKVVGVVQFAAIACLLVVRVAMDAPPERRLRDLVRACIAFGAGALVPVLILELWRLHWLGATGYKAWWTLQLERIGNQSGAVPRVAQSTWLQKIPGHFARLAAELARQPMATAALLVLPLLSAAFPIVRRVRRPLEAEAPRAWITFGLALVCAAYIPWWLAIVPDDKVWMRYLFIALIALAILAAMGLGGHAFAAFRAKAPVRRVLHAALVMGLFAVFAPFVWRSLPKHRVPTSPTEDRQAALWAANVVSKLPKDRLAFGWGWYSAPVIQLYADRPFYDLTDFPIGLLTRKPAYLVADKHAFVVGVIDPLLARYPYRKLMRDNPYAQVYELDFSEPNDPFAAADLSLAKPWVDFAATDYPLVFGFLPYNPSVGGRMGWSDTEVLLRYGGESTFAFAAYMAEQRFYLRPVPLQGRIVIEGCPPMPFAYTEPGWKQFKLPLTCRPQPGAVRARMLLDNVFDLTWEKTQQEAILVRSIGFAR
jgi:hypothetical protein